MKKIIFTSILFILISCNDNNIFTTELTKKNNCWVYLNKHEDINLISKKKYGGNHFNINGKVESIRVENGVKKETLNFENTKNTGEWEYTKNGYLEFFYLKLKIIKVKKDTIVVVDLHSKKKHVFINLPYSQK